MLQCLLSNKGIVMSRKCQITKKRFGKGKTYNYRGIAKYKGGIGLNITGSCKRQHRPNLFIQRFWSSEKGYFVKLKVSAHGMRIIDKIGVDQAIKKYNLKNLAG